MTGVLDVAVELAIMLPGALRNYLSSFSAINIINCTICGNKRHLFFFDFFVFIFLSRESDAGAAQCT